MSVTGYRGQDSNSYIEPKNEAEKINVEITEKESQITENREKRDFTTLIKDIRNAGMEVMKSENFQKSENTLDNSPNFTFRNENRDEKKLQIRTLLELGEDTSKIAKENVTRSQEEIINTLEETINELAEQEQISKLSQAFLSDLANFEMKIDNKYVSFDKALKSFMSDKKEGVNRDNIKNHVEQFLEEHKDFKIFRKDETGNYVELTPQAFEDFKARLLEYALDLYETDLFDEEKEVDKSKEKPIHGDQALPRTITSRETRRRSLPEKVDSKIKNKEAALIALKIAQHFFREQQQQIERKREERLKQDEIRHQEIREKQLKLEDTHREINRAQVNLEVQHQDDKHLELIQRAMQNIEELQHHLVESGDKTDKVQEDILSFTSDVGFKDWLEKHRIVDRTSTPAG